jgi:hypothetical protein
LSADDRIERLREHYERLGRDGDATRCAVFLAALPVCSRFPAPAAKLEELYGIALLGPPDAEALSAALKSFVPAECMARSAADAAIGTWLAERRATALFAADPWGPWREADGSAFCDLGRQFFTELNRLSFTEELGLEEATEVILVFAKEMSLITRTFSARWFNACARDRVPELGSIRWYLGHCLGKLDLELARERSDWIEEPRPWRSRQDRLLDVA